MYHKNSTIEISKKKIAINSTSFAVAKFVNLLVLVWLHQHLLRRISTNEYCIYPLLMSVMLFLPLLETVLISGIVRYVVVAYARGEERRVVQIVSTMFPILLVTGIVVVVAGGFFSWYINYVFTISPELLYDARVMMFLLVVGFAVRSVLTPFGLGMHIRQKFVWLNLIMLGTELLRIGILFLLLFGISTRVLWVAVASVPASFCGILAKIMISRYLVPSLRFRLNEIRWQISKELLSFGGWNLIAQTARAIRYNSIPILLNILATPMDITCFSLGRMFHKQTFQIWETARASLGPPLTAMHATEKKDQLRNAYLRGGRYALWAMLFVAAPIMVYRRELITLYVGEKYLPAAVLIFLLFATYPLELGNIMVSLVARARGQVKSLALTMILMQATGVSLAIYFVGSLSLGAFGAALSILLVTLVFEPLFILPLGLRLAEVSLHRYLREVIWPGLKPGLAGTLIWQVLRLVFPITGWLSLGFSVACGCGVYVAVLILCSLQPCDSKDMAKAMFIMRYSLLTISKRLGIRRA